jgi:hypothetical protein
VVRGNSIGPGSNEKEDWYLDNPVAKREGMTRIAIMSRGIIGLGLQIVLVNKSK